MKPITTVSPGVALPGRDEARIFGAVARAIMLLHPAPIPAAAAAPEDTRRNRLRDIFAHL